MSAGIQHLDPRIFPNPLTFSSERWIGDLSLSRYMVPFTKGSRQCLGYNLAYSELYLCLNAVFGHYGVKGMNSPAKLSLYKTSKEDVELDHHLFVPGPKAGSKGVIVVLER
jgi:cytochrome P450